MFRKLFQPTDMTIGTPWKAIAIFSIPGALSETGKLVWFGVTYVVWDTVYTLTDAPAYAMLNTMTDNIQERTTLLSINRIYSGVGQGICGAVLTLLISEKITHVGGMFQIDLTFLVYWAILMLLSYVFQYGEQLQQLSDETL